MSLIVTEPYLGSELAGLALLGVLWLLAGAERWRMLLAGLVPLLMLPMVPLMDAGYWAPRRLWDTSVGIEDGLYMLHIGACAWFFASRAGPFVSEVPPTPRAVLHRLAWLTGAALAGWAALVWVGLGWNEGLLVTALGIGGAALWRRPGQWRAALAGGLGNALWFGAELRLWFLLWPELADWWTAGAWSSGLVLGVPMGDVVYAGLFGAVHPLVLAAVLGGRFVRGGGARP